MALTKPKLSQNIDTDISVFSDPILVLHQGSALADVDVGFLMNRSNGLTSNAAVIWQESSKSFVHILTNSSGVNNANLAVQSYANVSVGNVLLINNAGIYVDGTLGTAGQVLASDGSKTYWAPPGGFTGGTVSGKTVFESNLVVSNTTPSANSVTGALVVRGGAGIAGNVYADALRTTTGIYWAGNGNPIAGITYTASSSPPTGPTKGDQWYNTTTDKLYEYLFDGASSYWVDIQTSIIAANVGTILTDQIQANLGAYQTYANANVVAIQANLGAFYSYANTKIGTNTDSNIVVSSGAASNYYNSAGAGSGVDIVSTTASKVGYLNIVGGTGSSGVLTFGNISSVQAVITTGTDSSITFATKSPTTGANAASAAFTINSDQTARFFSNLTVTGNVSIGANVTSNVTFSQSGLFRGPYDENSTLSGVFVGNTGAAPGITPRVGFFNGNTQQNWQIDNNAGAFRWFVPGSSKMTLYSTGNLNVTGGYTVGGKKAVNGPAFSAYANSAPQTITTGSQQKVIFGTEEFDTDNCFTGSRFTPTVEGYYQLNAEVRLDGASGTGEMMIVLYKNGAEHKRGTNQSGTQIASNFWAMTVSSLVYANGTGDYFEVYVQQGSGGSVTVTAVNTPGITWFNGCMLRGA